MLLVLAVGGVFKGIDSANYQLWISKGLARRLLRFYAVSRPLMILVILAGLPWGPVGVAAGHLVAALAHWRGAWWVCRLVGISIAPSSGRGCGPCPRHPPGGLLAHVAAGLPGAAAAQVAIGLGLGLSWTVAVASPCPRCGATAAPSCGPRRLARRGRPPERADEPARGSGAAVLVADGAEAPISTPLPLATSTAPRGVGGDVTWDAPGARWAAPRASRKAPRAASSARVVEAGRGEVASTSPTRPHVLLVRTVRRSTQARWARAAGTNSVTPASWHQTDPVPGLERVGEHRVAAPAQPERLVEAQARRAQHAEVEEQVRRRRPGVDRAGRALGLAKTPDAPNPAVGLALEDRG